MNTSRQRGFAMVEILINATIVSVLAAISLPSFTSIIASQRLSTDVRNVGAALTVARMRGAARFTRARVSINSGAGTFQIEAFDKSANAYVLEGGAQALSPGDSFGYGSLTTPAGSQTTIALSTSITFNSRGIPIDNSGAPTGNSAIYLTDGAGRYRAVTVSISSLASTWAYDGSAWSRTY